MRKGLLGLPILFLLLLQAAPLSALVPNQPDGSETGRIIDDIIIDFQLFGDLLAIAPGDIHHRAEAIAWLAPGFESDLAAAIVDCYLQFQPELNCMTVIPTDSIPVITSADRSFCRITQLNNHPARLDRIYSNCYSPGDCWLYQVTAEKSERWKIVDISLSPLN